MDKIQNILLPYIHKKKNLKFLAFLEKIDQTHSLEGKQNLRAFNPPPPPHSGRNLFSLSLQLLELLVLILEIDISISTPSHMWLKLSTSYLMFEIKKVLSLILSIENHFEGDLTTTLILQTKIKNAGHVCHIKKNS